MSKTIAIIGSRGFRDQDELIRAILKRTPDIGRLVSGGARGIDQAAERIASELGLEVVVHRPDYKLLPKHDAPKVRNWRIVGDADIVVAIWDGWSGGTAHAVTAATALGKTVVVYAPEEIKALVHGPPGLVA